MLNFVTHRLMIAQELGSFDRLTALKFKREYNVSSMAVERDAL